MKRLRCAILAVFLTGLVSINVLAADAPAPAYPPHTIPNSQLRVLPKSATGRQYQLHISLPGNYSKETNKRYPVVF